MTIEAIGGHRTLCGLFNISRFIDFFCLFYDGHQLIYDCRRKLQYFYDKFSATELAMRSHRFVYLFDWISIYDSNRQRNGIHQKTLFTFLNTKTYDPDRGHLNIFDYQRFVRREYFVCFVAFG